MIQWKIELTLWARHAFELLAKEMEEERPNHPEMSDAEFKKWFHDQSEWVELK